MIAMLLLDIKQTDSDVVTENDSCAVLLQQETCSQIMALICFALWATLSCITAFGMQQINETMLRESVQETIHTFVEDTLMRAILNRHAATNQSYESCLNLSEPTHSVKTLQPLNLSREIVEEPVNNEDAWTRLDELD